MSTHTAFRSAAQAAAAACISTYIFYSAPAAAQAFDAKTGLWQTTITTETSGAPPFDLSKLSPEQRARIEQMMKQRQAAGPHSTTHQSCVTQKELNEGGGNFAAPKHCATQFSTRTATHVKGTMNCKSDSVTSQGDFDYQVSGRDNVKGLIHMTMNGAGHTQKVTVQMQSKWLGSDCKGLKPGQ